MQLHAEATQATAKQLRNRVSLLFRHSSTLQLHISPGRKGRGDYPDS